MTDRYASLKQGLVGCWIPSVSGSGLLLPDLSMRGNNGSLVNMDASDWVSSGSGRALDFDGVDDVTRVALSAPAMPFTISAWILSRSDSANQFPIAFCRSASDEGQFSIRFAGNVAGDPITVRQEGDAGGTVGEATFTGYATNQWYHVTAIFRSNTYRQIYVNGVAGTENTTSVTTPSINRFAIGRFDRLNPAVPLNGNVDDVRVYSRELTESEIKLLASDRGIGFKPAKKLSRFSQRFTYKPPKARNYGVVRVKETDYATLRQGLVGAWCPSLPNGGSGNTLPDVSGYGNHGVLTNMSPDDWVSGQYGRALDFDILNDTVSLGANVSTGGNVSVTGWIRRNGGGQNSNNVICAKGSLNGDSSSTLALYYNDSLGWSWFCVDAGNNLLICRSLSSTSLNQWYFVCGTLSANNLRLYVDGQNVASVSGGAVKTSTHTTAIGRADSIGGNCQLDDIRVFNRELSEPEIKLLASRPGIGLRQESHRQTFYQFPSGARRKRILTGMP